MSEDAPGRGSNRRSGPVRHRDEAATETEPETETETETEPWRDAEARWTAVSDMVAKQISGAWTNQLGSRLVVEVDESGLVTGTFEPGVSGDGNRHTVSGYVDPSPGEGAAPLGLVVTWQPAHSVTVWSGHYHRDKDTINATWLLASHPADHRDWHAMTLGHDSFGREAERGSPDDAGADVDEELLTGF